MGDGLYLGKQVDPEQREARRAAGARSGRPPDPRPDRRHDRLGQDRPRDRPDRGAAAPGRPRDRDRPEGRPRATCCCSSRARRRPPFEPWIDAERRAARGQGREAAAASDAAAAWKKGLAEWGLGAAEIAALKQSHDAVVYTPGSGPGVPLNVLQSLDAPGGRLRRRRGGPARRDPVDRHRPARPRRRRGRSAPVAAGRLPGQPRRDGWRAGKGLTPGDARSAPSPTRPSTRSARCRSRRRFPRKERQGLMMALNNLLASPSFEAWREGEPLDVERMLRAPGRPPAPLDRLDRAPGRRGAALRDRAAARQGEDVDAAPGRHDGAAGARLHGRDLRLLPAAPREPADQAPAAHAAQAGARAGRGRRARHAEPGRPRLQGPRQHGHLAGRDAADAAGPRAARRAACRARGSRPTAVREAARGHEEAGLPAARRPPPAARASSSRAGRCPTCAGRSRATRSRG